MVFSFPVLSVFCRLRSADYVDLLDIASLLTRRSGKGQIEHELSTAFIDKKQAKEDALQCIFSSVYCITVNFLIFTEMYNNK